MDNPFSTQHQKLKLSIFFFFSQNEATFPLVRKDYYIESLQRDLYTHRGDFLRSSKEDEPTYIALQPNLM